MKLQIILFVTFLQIKADDDDDYAYLQRGGCEPGEHMNAEGEQSFSFGTGQITSWCEYCPENTESATAPGQKDFDETNYKLWILEEYGQPCASCMPGTYREATDDNDCIPCPPGKFTEGNRIACEYCKAQKEPNASSDQCQNCPPGMTRALNDDTNCVCIHKHKVRIGGQCMTRSRACKHSDMDRGEKKRCRKTPLDKLSSFISTIIASTKKSKSKHY